MRGYCLKFGLNTLMLHAPLDSAENYYADLYSQPVRAGAGAVEQRDKSVATLILSSGLTRLSSTLTHAHLYRLRPDRPPHDVGGRNRWVCDEVLSHLVLLLRMREAAKARLIPDYKARYIASPHLFTLICGADATGSDDTFVRIADRWHFKKHINLFELDFVAVPANINNTHWVWFAIFPLRKEIHGLCLLHRSLARYVPILLKWLSYEAKAWSWLRDSLKFVASEWKYVDVKGPLQKGNADCFFLLAKGICYSLDNLPLTFTQEDMTFFRRRTIADLLCGSRYGDKEGTDIFKHYIVHVDSRMDKFLGARAVGDFDDTYESRAQGVVDLSEDTDEE